jgi:uncharacterized membrane protein
MLMPLIAAGLAGFLALIPRLDPRAAHLAQSGHAYAVIWAALILFFAALHLLFVLDILGYGVPIERLVPAALGLMLVLVGASLPRLRSNFFVGIRTPWTLSSESAWERTHRLGGRLFVVLGLTNLILPLIVDGKIWTYWLVGSMLLAVIILTVYSYLVWRGDMDARPTDD